MLPASEDDILTIIQQYFPEKHPQILLGRGDDCAILTLHGSQALTTDIFAEDVHFRRRYFTPFDIGFKALAVNLSDIASSGAVPGGISLGLTLTGNEDLAWIHNFCKGIKTLSSQFSLAVSGGDLSKATALNICITAWGTLPKELPLGLRRGQAQEGDILFLIGTAGLALTGFSLLEKNNDPQSIKKILREWPHACRQHLRPFPMVQEGCLLARFAAQKHLENRISLMDLSDGLAQDLPRLLNTSRTGLGGDIHISCLDQEVLRYAKLCGIPAENLAFKGGEDYALLGSCPPEYWTDLTSTFAKISPNIPTAIGIIKKGSITLQGKKTKLTGFDHFNEHR
jgi:thiamine-monophosphate kinase